MDYPSNPRDYSEEDFTFKSFLDNPRISQIPFVVRIVQKEASRIEHLFDQINKSNLKKSQIKAIEDVVHNALKDVNVLETTLLQNLNGFLKKNELQSQYRVAITQCLKHSPHALSVLSSFLIHLVSNKLKDRALSIMALVNAIIREISLPLEKDINFYMYIESCASTLGELASNQRALQIGVKEFIQLQNRFFYSDDKPASRKKSFELLSKELEYVKDASTCIQLITISESICSSEEKKLSLHLLRSIADRIQDERKTVRFSAIRATYHFYEALKQFSSEIQFKDVFSYAGLRIVSLMEYLFLNRIGPKEEPSYQLLEDISKDSSFLEVLKIDLGKIIRFTTDSDTVIQSLSIQFLLNSCFTEKNVRWESIRSLCSDCSPKEMEAIRNSASSILSIKNVATILEITRTWKDNSLQISLLDTVSLVVLFEGIVFGNRDSRVDGLRAVENALQQFNGDSFLLGLDVATSLLRKNFQERVKLIQFAKTNIGQLLATEKAIHFLFEAYRGSVVEVLETLLSLETYVLEGETDIQVLIQGIVLALMVMKDFWVKEAQKRGNLDEKSSERAEISGIGGGSSFDEIKSFFLKDFLRKGCMKRYTKLAEGMALEKEMASCQVSLRRLKSLVSFFGERIRTHPQSSEKYALLIFEMLHRHLKESSRFSEELVVMIVKEMCILMRYIPSLVEKEIMNIFESVQSDSLTLSSHSRNTIILLVGDLCIEKLVNDSKLLLIFTDIFKKDDYLAEAAATILAKVLASFEDSAQVALVITQRFSSAIGSSNKLLIEQESEFHVHQSSPNWLEERGTSVREPESRLDSFIQLISSSLKAKDLQVFSLNLIDMFFEDPSLKTAQMMTSFVPRNEKATEKFVRILAAKGVYFFRNLKDVSKEEKEITALLLKCADALCRKDESLLSFKKQLLEASSSHHISK